MSDDNYLTEQFDTFIENISDRADQEKLFFTAGIVELLRHTKAQKTVLALAELLVSLPAVDWDRIPFSITKTLLSKTYTSLVWSCGVPVKMTDEILLLGLLEFLRRFQTEPPTEQLLKDIVKKIATAVADEIKTEKPPALKANPVPELFNHRLSQRVFEPTNVTDDILAKLDAKLVYFSAPISEKSMGPEIRGLAFDNGTNRYFVLLESGEFITVPKDYEHLRIVKCDVLFPGAPTSLFLALGVAAPLLETYAVISKPQLEFIINGGLGKMLHPLHGGVAGVEDISALEHAFDIGQESAMIGVPGATGPVGATTRFPIPDTDLFVVLTASRDAHGPYSTAELIRADAKGADTVLMRHETPRLYSLRGVYLFPLKDRLISLVIIF